MVTRKAIPRPPIASSPYYGSRHGGGYGRGRGGAAYGGGRYAYGRRHQAYYRPYRPYYPNHFHHYYHYPRPRAHGSFFYFPGYGFNVGVSFGYGYGYPAAFGHYGYSGYAYFPYGYVGYASTPSYADPYTGFLRLKVKPRDAQVFVDGSYVGLVDHFDGWAQRLRLEEGTHHVEIRHPDYIPIEFEVLIVTGEKVTFEEQMLFR